MSEEPQGWRMVAQIGDLPEAVLVEMAVGPQRVVLLRRGGHVGAFQGLCPHQFARLVEGRVKDGWLHCPRHHACFSLADGHCGPGWVLPSLKRFAVKVADGRVMLSDPLVTLA
ncbi:MAG: Rieske 2Fe-2S domain-containing protein [Kiloniellaceae bacterium]